MHLHVTYVLIVPGMRHLWEGPAPQGNVIHSAMQVTDKLGQGLPPARAG